MAIGLATFGYVGWDGALWDARYQLLLHAFALAAVACLLGVAWRGGLLPRTRVDVLVLLLAAAFAVATLSAENAGLATRALAVVLATAAMLPVALVALRHRPQWVALVAIVPTLALAAGTLLVMVVRRLGWFWVDAGTIVPPIRIGAEGSPFGSVATPPFMLLAVAPLTLLVADPRWRRRLQLALLVVGVPLTILSGSRSAWIAVGLAGLAFLAGELGTLRERLPRQWTPRVVAVAVAAVAGIGVAGVLVAPRLTAIGSLAYRVDLWRDTLTAWSSDPLLGIGPGTMPYARQAAAEALTFPARQPHSHNLPLGLLGDAGIIGLLAGVALAVAFFWVAGPWRSRTPLGRAAASVLVGLAVSGLFEDLTFIPDYNLLVLLLAAIALTDAGAVRWQPVAMRQRFAIPLGIGLLAISVPWLLGDGAAIAYRGAVDRFAEGAPAAAVRGLEVAERLDPWHPATPKALAVAADAAGDATTALAAARRAVELNPGDGRSWTNIALLCLASGDEPCAATAAGSAADRADPFSLELVNAAIVSEALADHARADTFLRLSALTNLRTTLAVAWPRRIDPGAAPVAAIDPATAQLSLLVARRTQGLAIDPGDYPAPIVHAVAARMIGDRATSEMSLADAQREAPYDAVTWDLGALLAVSWGEDPGPAMRVGAVIRGSPIAGPGTLVDPMPPGLTFDIGSFRIYPRDGLVGAAERLLGSVPYPWYLAPLLDPAYVAPVPTPAGGGG